MFVRFTFVLSALCAIQFYQHRRFACSADSLLINPKIDDRNVKLSNGTNVYIKTAIDNGGNQCSYCASCGVTNKRSKIVGGIEADPFEFPWIAVLRKNGAFHCGGSIITRYHILTAGHCTTRTSANQLTAVLGEYDMTQGNDKRQMFQVNGIIQHPQYNSVTDQNDIAILRLQTAVTFNSRFIQMACLPTFGHRNYAGTMATVAGWGLLHKDDRSTPSKLRKVQIPIVPLSGCPRVERVTTWVVCAGFPQGGRSPCMGDSGGPLHIPGPNPGTMTVIGIVSGGIPCALPNSPAVFTQIDHYMYWVNSVVGNECMCTR